MSRILCVPNWSEGRDEKTLSVMRLALADEPGLAVHFFGADPDHNRLVTAFSGDFGQVRRALERLAETAFANIDMGGHDGVHPRIGALDVCPFILLEERAHHKEHEEPEALEFALETGRRLAETYDLPVFLYEKSETGKHAVDLPSLRMGQYEGLLGRPLDPDFGPEEANTKLGATVLGVRAPLIAMNVNLPDPDPATALRIASRIRDLRAEGDPRFAGVRALGLKLASRGLSQVSMNLTHPDETAADRVIDWIEESAGAIAGTELIGVIREKDLAGGTRLPVAPEQVV